MHDPDRLAGTPAAVHGVVHRLARRMAYGAGVAGGAVGGVAFVFDARHPGDVVLEMG